MAEAVRLAAGGLYTTDPNPRVGCVLVRDGAVVGRGFHRRAGEAHAEVAALADAGDLARGATAYVTLEPCAHQGRTGPCAEALIVAGVRRVLYAVGDPNPRVSGAGAERLRAVGIAVESGLLSAAAEALNPGFLKRFRHRLPYVRVKVASSLDGRTALANGRSQWLTGAAARADVQRLRARSSAVLSGASTVDRDDARLTVRDAGIDMAGRRPLRVVLDPQLIIRPTARIFAEEGPVLVVTGSDDEVRAGALRAAGAEVLGLPLADARNLRTVLEHLAAREINEVLVEAGPRLAGSFIEAGLADEFLLYLAPHMLGHDGAPLAMLPMLDELGERWNFRFADVTRVGEDLRLTLVPLPRGD
jgi:diaminohydroxyphosphoribosylaminopyrimidine deaminase/5-amino-6-(5-phosphoribosylamino)uracil reductase